MEPEPTADEIKGLKSSIKVREGVRDGLSVDHKSFDALTRELAVDKERLFLMEQQGKFSSPISVVLSYSYRSHIFAHSHSTSSLHPFSGGKRAR